MWRVSAGIDAAAEIIAALPDHLVRVERFSDAPPFGLTPVPTANLLWSAKEVP